MQSNGRPWSTTFTVQTRNDATAGAPAGASLTRKITITSQTDTAVKDAVKATGTCR